ncbi:YcaO-like family protein [Burkholderia sp. MS455]|uniref:YcaO-like family protein n=1 Tax=Burkholderia sp. MS455 TaxID=2811788 RepID=UPI00195B2ABC|nr:YcaO-like family protein [Burkholderia sp. MS455]
MTPKQVATSLIRRTEALGISRFSNLGPFVSLDVRVVQAVRVTLADGQVSATTGKGWNLWQALCGALGEAFERYCAAHPPVPDVTHRDIAQAVSLAGWGHPVNFVPRDVFPAHELISGRSFLLPALEVYFPYHGPDRARTSVRPHTSGLASGSTLEEATLFGLLEVIERHTSSMFFSQFLHAPTGALIHAGSIPHSPITSALEELTTQGYESFIFRIDALLPVYYVAILDTANLGPKFMVSGVAAHLDEYQALEGAFLEAMQAVVIAAQGAREDLSRHASSYRDQQMGQRNPYYRIRSHLAHTNPTIAFPHATVALNQSAAEVLPHLLTYLRGAGVQSVYRCDLSPPGWPLHAVKLIVPGMFDTHINSSRCNLAATTACPPHRIWRPLTAPGPRSLST